MAAHLGNLLGGVVGYFLFGNLFASIVITSIIFLLIIVLSDN